ncbi:MAG: TetR/AcrR family transcriptional regulator [Dorea sp.]|nr:TetR/AcrR family transcriptional regulator [Dorea sp.]
MKRDGKDDTKKRIVEAAWKLFREKGYEKTTVNEIIKTANTSKGGFYYYFEAKDALLNSLYDLFDEDYMRFYESMDQSMDCFTQLTRMCRHVYAYTEEHVSPELMARLYQAQLLDKKQDSFMNPERYYVKLVKAIIKKGQDCGEFRDDMSVDVLSHLVLVIDRGILVDWSIENGKFSLKDDGSKCFELYIQFIRK